MRNRKQELEILYNEFLKLVDYLDANPKDFAKINYENSKLIARVNEEVIERKNDKLQYLMARFVFHDPKDIDHINYKTLLEKAVGRGNALAHFDLARNYAYGRFYPMHPLKAGQLISIVLQESNENEKKQANDLIATDYMVASAYQTFLAKYSPSRVTATGALGLGKFYWRLLQENKGVFKEFDTEENRILSNNLKNNMFHLFDVLLSSEEKNTIARTEIFLKSAPELNNLVANYRNSKKIPPIYSIADYYEFVRQKNMEPEVKDVKEIKAGSLTDKKDEKAQTHDKLASQEEITRQEKEKATEKNRMFFNRVVPSIEKDLSDSKSEFSESLRTMQREKKWKLIAGIVMGDKSIIQELMKESIKKLNLPQEDIDQLKQLSHLITMHSKKQFFEHDKTNPQWLSPLASKLVSMLLQDPITKMPMQNLELIAMLKFAMQSIPDHLIDVRVKYAICAGFVDQKDLAGLIRLNYTEIVKPIKAQVTSAETETKLKSINKVNTLDSLSESQYKLMLKNKKLDASDFILITTRFLQSVLSQNIFEGYLKEIQRYYMKLDYQACFRVINYTCQQISDKISKEAIELIKGFPDKLIPSPLDRNFSRRFYETRLAQYMYGSLEDKRNPGHLKTADANIFKRLFAEFHEIFNGKDSMPKFEIETLADLTLAIDTFSELPDDESLRLMNALQANSPNYTIRSKEYKTGIAEKKDEVVGFSGLESISSQSGIMMAKQFAYYDETTTHGLRNRLPDSRTVSQKNSYSYYRENVPYVGSISGHIYFLVAMLAKYLDSIAEKNFADSAAVNTNLNKFVNAYITTYIGFGLHSLVECIDVFEEPEVKGLLGQFAIRIEPFLGKDYQTVLSASFKDAQDYAKTNVLRQNFLQELLIRQQVSEKNQESKFHGLVSDSKELNPETLAKIQDFLRSGYEPTDKDKKLLLDYVKDKELLHKCIQYNITGLFKYLINNKSDINFVSKSKDFQYSNLSPLQFAAKNGYNTLLRELLDLNHLQINFTNLDKKTALDLAVENNKPNCVVLLIKKGATFNKLAEVKLVQFMQSLNHSKLSNEDKQNIYKFGANFVSNKNQELPWVKALKDIADIKKYILESKVESSLKQKLK